MIKDFICRLFGHDEVGANFKGWFCTTYKCKRCGHERDPEAGWK
jgi:transposase